MSHTKYKDKICDIDNKGRGMELYKSSFCILLKLEWYQFKLDCYNVRKLNVISGEITEKICTEHTERKWEGSQNFIQTN